MSSTRTESGAPTNAVAFVSARTGRLIGHSEALNAPLQSAFYGGALWNLSFTGILSKIDPQTGDVVDTANTVPVPCGLAAGEGALWVSDCNTPTVVRIDPAHDVVVGRGGAAGSSQRARGHNAERRRRGGLHLGWTGLR